MKTKHKNVLSLNEITFANNMSSSKRHCKKKHSHQVLETDKEYIPLYMKHRLAKVKKVQQIVQSLCDDSSSVEDTLPSVRFSAMSSSKVDARDLEKKTKESLQYKGQKSNQSNESESSSEEDDSKLLSDDSLVHENKKTKTSKSLQKGSRRSSSSLIDDSENDYDKQKVLNKEFIKSDKHKNNTKNKKVIYSDIRKENSKNARSECSDSEYEICETSPVEKERKLNSKSIPGNFTSFLKEEADSSSGKEFQTSKLSHNDSGIMKKLSEIKGHYVKSTKLNPISTKCTKGKTFISQEHSLHFKSRVIKILNKFKEVCSEYELQMEHVKWKHFKKELTYQESAKYIIDKSKDVITKLKMELDAQEKELITFYEEWHQKCNLQSESEEDSSSSENEVLQTITHKEKYSHLESKLSQKGSIVSECDSEEIFSENEIVKTDVEINKGEKHLTLSKLSKKLVDDNNENTLSSERNCNASPILGKTKCNNKKKISDEMHLENKSQIIDANEEGSIKSKEVESEHDINNSVQDIFENTINSAENVEDTDTLKENQSELDQKNNLKSEEGRDKPEIAKSDSNKDKDLLKSGELNTEPDGKDSETDETKNTVSETLCSQETLESKINDTDSVATVRIERSENNSLDELNEEEKAKKALLESDSESFFNEESSSEKSNKVSTKDNLQSDNVISVEEKQETKTKTDSIHADNLSDQQNEIDTAELSAKRALLDSNSDDSMSFSSVKNTSDKKQSESDNSEDRCAKTKLLVSSSSDSSSSDNDDFQNKKVDFVSKKQKGKEESEKDSLRDDNLLEFDISVSERVKKRRIKLNNKYDLKSDEKLKMHCRVVIERLLEKDVKKYANVLSKSQKYLEAKEIESLIDLDRLKRNCKKVSDITRNSSRKKKTKMVTEAEDSLLDHLQKIENGGFIENLEHSGFENNDPENNNPENNNAEKRVAFTSKEELMMEADRAAKRILLNSDSDIEEQDDELKSNNSEEEKSKSETENSSLSPKKEKKSSINNKEGEKYEKSRWKRNKVLTMKLSSDSDSEVERENWHKKQKKLQEKAEENNTENSDVKDTVVKRKRRTRRKILDSDSDVELVNSDSESNISLSDLLSEDDKSSDSSVGKKKIRKRKMHKSSDSDSSFAEKRSKPKRKRIKNMDTDSDNSNDNDEITNSQGTSGKKGRKNIRKVIKDKQVADDTKQAAKEEEERLKRIAERQKLYNEMYEARLVGEEKVEKLVLDFDPETKKELLSVHMDLVKRLKPHQAKGIKFMWDSCFESLERIKSSAGSGCIIAHCMGLGKTLQVIALVHTLLTHDGTDIKTIMVVCPLSTVFNWLNEFKLWLKDIDNEEIEVYELTKFKKNIERKYQLESWQRTGGVLIIGYEMFRNLSGTNNKMRKNMKEAILQYLIDPGPDVIVCDEGHLLKNEDTALSKSMKRIRTLRRIVLTGTPLQNNLVEYHCMVQFVKPSLLGTKKEFLNRFANPITNGQFDDSTENDVKLMKKRAYVLHKMLKGCVQRFDYSVLMPFLPPKQEYVIFVRLTDVQIKMYQHYLINFARRQRAAGGSLFADFQALQRIWTHPTVLRLNAEKMERVNERKFSSSDSEGSLKDFINDDTEAESDSSTSSSESDDDIKSVESTVMSTRSTKRNNNADVEVISKSEENEKKEEEWWLQFIQPEHFEDMRISAKLLLLFGILKECEQIGDKVLVFSQSLYSLTLIEQFLEKIDNETQQGTNSEYINGHNGSWSLGLDYFRLDGQTSAENRNVWCKIFNKPSNMRARLFLISTRAGGLGINLTAANRVIIFDASWNPSHDVQSIFRVYRFGQKKPCYVYRFLAAGTMEEKIYNRQVTKLSLSCRVVDEQQIDRHYSNHDLSELYKFDLYTNPEGEKPTLNLPKDRLLADIFLKYKDLVENYHEHDSLLENKAEEELNEEERKQAWLEYEEEKKGKPMLSYPTIMPISSNVILNQYNLPTPLNVSIEYEKLQELIRKDYPNSTPEYQQMMTTRALSDMYNYWEQQTYNATKRMTNQNAGIMPPQMRIQVPNLVRLPLLRQNTNNMNNQTRNELPFTFINTDAKPRDSSDDVIEVSPNTATNKSKNQEE